MIDRLIVRIFYDIFSPSSSFISCNFPFFSVQVIDLHFLASSIDVLSLLNLENIYFHFVDLDECLVGINAFFYTIFVSSHMYPENPEGTQVIVGSMNMGYISDTARNRTHNLFRP